MLIRVPKYTQPHRYTHLTDMHAQVQLCITCRHPCMSVLPHTHTCTGTCALPTMQHPLSGKVGTPGTGPCRRSSAGFRARPALNSTHPQLEADSRSEMSPKGEDHPFDPQISLLFPLILGAPSLPRLLGLGLLSQASFLLRGWGRRRGEWRSVK